MTAGAVVTSDSEVRPDVQLYTSPWVSGTRSLAYFGQISADLFVPDRLARNLGLAFEAAELAVRDVIQEKAQRLGANAVVSFEFTADLWCERGPECGMHFHATGVAAKLEQLLW